MVPSTGSNLSVLTSYTVSTLLVVSPYWSNAIGPPAPCVLVAWTALTISARVASGAYSPDTTRKAIVKAVQDTKINGAGGPISFDQYGDTTNKVLTVYTVKGSDFAPIEGSTGSFTG